MTHDTVPETAGPERARRPERDTLLPPPATRALSRPRLLRLLDDAAGADLVVVRAPGGSGKTTLLADWLRRRPAEELVAWVALDERAQTRAGFWRVVIGALVRAGLLPARGAIAEDTAGFLSSEFAAAAVAAEINRQGCPVRVVVDDLQFAPPEAEHDLARLAGLLRSAHLVVATRRPGALESALYAVRMSVTVVTGEQLAFSAHETQDVSEAVDSPLGPGEAEELHAATGGHALLTRLLLAGELRGDHDSATGTVAETVTEIMADRLMTALTADSLEFGLLIAQSPAVDAGLAAAMSGAADAAERLDRFVRDGLGSFDREGLFSFHELIRSALLHRAAEDLPAERRAEAASVAATFFSERPGHALTTVQLLAASGRTGEILGWFAMHFSELATYSGAAVEAVLRGLPPRVLAADGGLGAVLVIIQSEWESSPSAGLLRTASAAIADLRRRPATLEPDELLFRELAVFGALRASRRYAEARRAADRSLELIRHFDAETYRRLEPAIGAGFLQSAITHLLTGDLDGTLRIIDLLAGDAHDGRRQHGRALRAYIQAVRGDMRSAAATLDTVQDARVARWRSSIAATGWHIARSLTALENGGAREALESIRAMESRLAYIEHWPFILWALGRIHLALDPLAGIEDVDRLLAEHGRRPASPAPRALLNAGIADLAIASGDIGRALGIVRQRQEKGMGLHLSAARLGLITGDESVPGALRRLLERPGLWPRQRAEALLLLAVHQHRAGRADAAGDAFRRAMAIVGECELSTPLMMVPRADVEAIAAATGLALPPALGDADPFGESLRPLALTARERVLLQKLATGAALKQIAADEFVSLNTVKTQAASLYRKLGAASRHEAVDIARRRGLLR